MLRVRSLFNGRGHKYRCRADVECMCFRVHLLLLSILYTITKHALLKETYLYWKEKSCTIAILLNIYTLRPYH